MAGRPAKGMGREESLKAEWLQAGAGGSWPALGGDDQWEAAMAACGDVWAAEERPGEQVVQVVKLVSACSEPGGKGSG